MKALTDYPFGDDGDFGKQVQLRACDVIAYDGDKYVTVICDGKKLDISWRHVFEEPGVHIRYATLARLPTDLGIV